MPGGAAGLQNQSGGRKVPGGFDSLPSPPRKKSRLHQSTLPGGDQSSGTIGPGHSSTRKASLDAPLIWRLGALEEELYATAR